MKNYEILSANNALGEIADQPIKGKLKFKLYKLKVALEDEALIIQETLKGSGKDEHKEIMEADNDTPFAVGFTIDELSELDLSIRAVSGLSPFVDELKNKDGE